MKCKYCGKQDEEKNLEKMVRFYKGEPVYSKRSGEPLYDYYHVDCKNHADNVAFVREFVGMVNGPDRQFPTRIMRDLKPIWEQYGYPALISYLKSIEDYIMNAKCNGTSHRLNLLVYMVKNNIDDFLEKDSPQKNEATSVKEVGFVERRSNNSFNDESYDLLD